MTKIDLSFPLTVEGRTVDSVTVRRPKVRDAQAMESARAARGDFPAVVALVAALVDLPVPVVEDMDAADFALISEAATGFLSSPKSTPETGEA